MQHNWICRRRRRRRNQSSSLTWCQTQCNSIGAGFAGIVFDAAPGSTSKTVVQQIAHAKIGCMLNQQLDHIGASVHDGADLFEASIDQRHVVPFQNLRNDNEHGLMEMAGHRTTRPRMYLVPLLQTAFLGHTARNGPDNVSKQAAIGSRFAAHNSHTQAASWEQQSKREWKRGRMKWNMSSGNFMNPRCWNVGHWAVTPLPLNFEIFSSFLESSLPPWIRKRPLRYLAHSVLF